MEVFVDGKHAFSDVIEDERVQGVDRWFHGQKWGGPSKL
jgi:hypothetical protein